MGTLALCKYELAKAKNKEYWYMIATQFVLLFLAMFILYKFKFPFIPTALAIIGIQLIILWMFC